MGTRSDEDLLDLEILEGMAGLFARLVAEGEELAKSVGIPAFIIKALHMLDTPLAMKDLGRRMHCDPSFITGIADTLEQRGLAARESDPGDRRVKRLVLTPAGAELKRRLEDEILARSPWRRALSQDERASLLALVRKMSPPQSATELGCLEEVNEFLASSAPLAAETARRQGRDSAGSGPATPPSAGSGPATPPSAGSGPATPPGAGSGPATPPRVPAPAAQ